MSNPTYPPLLAISAYSGTGKTTLLTNVIPLLKATGLRLGVIKHTHHEMDIDKPGKDSYELRKAGAEQTLVANNQRWALMTETPQNEEADLYHLLSQMAISTLDLVLVEGFRQEKVPKILLSRQGLGTDAHTLIDAYVIAIASDETADKNLALPWLDINKPDQVADFIIAWLNESADSAQ